MRRRLARGHAPVVAGSLAVMLALAALVIATRWNDIASPSGRAGGVAGGPFDGANYPPSTAITGIRWGPVMRRIGCGDNLPTTWAGDGAVYTAFGDCGGTTGRPSSITVAHLVGGDPATATVLTDWQSLGPQGPAGRKISGLISLEGTLFALVRNADGNGHGSLPALSTDRGRHWTFAHWRFRTSMGYPTFVNYGRDGAAAGDGFVYVVSPDSSSAYAPSPDPERQGMILARVPRGRILQRGAYRYFAGLVHGRPVWSPDVGRRALAFACRVTRCVRGQVSFDAGLGRYLWWQQAYRGTVDTRRSGGFGVYEAPAPWGPWRTVYFVRDSRADPGFADPPGDGGSFPAKWVSEDGRSLVLVCSCAGALSMRTATLRIGR